MFVEKAVLLGLFSGSLFFGGLGWGGGGLFSEWLIIGRIFWGEGRGGLLSEFYDKF